MKAQQHGVQRPPAHQIEGRASAVGLRGGFGARQPASRHQGTSERLAGERRAFTRFARRAARPFGPT